MKLFLSHPVQALQTYTHVKLARVCVRVRLNFAALKNYFLSLLPRRQKVHILVSKNPALPHGGGRPRKIIIV